MVAATGVELWSHWQAGLRPDRTAYAAAVYMFGSLQGAFAFTLTIMALYTLARSFAGMLDGTRRATFDNTMLLWHFVTAQGLIGLVVVAGFPRLLGA